MNADQLAKIRSRIAEIDALLSSGATTSTIDGTTVSFDLAALRTERDELRRQLPDDPGRSRRGAVNVRLG